MTTRKVGEVCTIIANTTCHCFDIGDVVVIRDKERNDGHEASYDCKYPNGMTTPAGSQVYESDLVSGTPALKEQDPLEAFIMLLEAGEFDDLICERFGGLGHRERTRLRKRSKGEWKI